MTTLEKSADFPPFVTAGGMTTQGKKRFFGNIFGASCVCIGECSLKEIKSDQQSGGFSDENKLAGQRAG